MSQWSQDQLQRMFDRAADLGHDCNNLISVRQTKTQNGWAVLCSCGWQSNSRKRKMAAAALAVFHVGSVIGEGESGASEMRGPVPQEMPATVPGKKAG